MQKQSKSWQKAGNEQQAKQSSATERIVAPESKEFIGVK
jgi:hypothetical protein